MHAGRVQPILSARAWLARPRAPRSPALAGVLTMLLLLDLLPCGGAACVWPASKAGGSPALAALASSLGTAPAPDVPTAPLSHPLECALHHEHCSLLITAAPLLGAALALVAILRAGPPLTAPAWAVPPLLPPP